MFDVDEVRGERVRADLVSAYNAKRVSDDDPSGPNSRATGRVDRRLPNEVSSTTPRTMQAPGLTWGLLLSGPAFPGSGGCVGADELVESCARPDVDAYSDGRWGSGRVPVSGGCRGGHRITLERCRPAGRFLGVVAALAESLAVLAPWFLRRRATGTGWSRWRIGASHHGVRHTSSRITRNWRSRPANRRRRESIATSVPLRGLAEEPCAPRRAPPPAPAAGPARPGPGRSRPAEPAPGRRRGACGRSSRPGPRPAVPVARSRPVQRATRVSAMIWPTVRWSPRPCRDSACRRRAACTATPWATGRNPVR